MQNRAVIKKRKRFTARFDDLSLRPQIFILLDHVGIPNVELPPYIMQARNLIFRAMIGITLVMSLCIMVWSLPVFHDTADFNFFSVVILISVVIFSVDWLVRLICAPHTTRYLLNFLNIVDIVGLIPYWLAWGGVIDTGIGQWILILRVTRVVRALLFLKNYNIVVTTIEESTEVGALLIMLFAVALPIIGSALYFTERGTYDAGKDKWLRDCRVESNCTTEVSPYQHAFAGMWYAANALTTLGIGDDVPLSDPGRIVGGLAMLVGVFTLSFPVMILAVNFETEKKEAHKDQLKKDARQGRFLQDMQREHTKVADKTMLHHAMIMQSQLGNRAESMNLDEDFMALSVLPRNAPVFFNVASMGFHRRAALVRPTEVRHDPLLHVQKHPQYERLVFLNQNSRNQYQFRFRVELGNKESSEAALKAVNSVLPHGATPATKCRHFHVPEIHFALHKPAIQCEFLRQVRLLRAYEDNIESGQRVVTATLELENATCTMDEQKVHDLAYALQRCRLRITAAVVYHDPIIYQVPVFLEMLKGTNLLRELTARKRGLTYLTEAQILDLVNGVHHLFDIRSVDNDEPLMILNVGDINQAVTKAVIKDYSLTVTDIDSVRKKDFLFGNVLGMKTTKAVQDVEYYGVFTNRLAGRAEDNTWWKVLLGMENVLAEENDVGSRDTKILCTVSVKCVIPAFQTVTTTM